MDDCPLPIWYIWVGDTQVQWDTIPGTYPHTVHLWDGGYVRYETDLW